MGFDQWLYVMDASLDDVNATVSRWELGATELHHLALRSCGDRMCALDVETTVG